MCSPQCFQGDPRVGVFAGPFDRDDGVLEVVPGQLGRDSPTQRKQAATVDRHGCGRPLRPSSTPDRGRWWSRNSGRRSRRERYSPPCRRRDGRTPPSSRRAAGTTRSPPMRDPCRWRRRPPSGPRPSGTALSPVHGRGRGIPTRKILSERANSLGRQSRGRAGPPV